MGLRFRMRLNIFSFLGKGPSRGSFFFIPFVRRLGYRDLRLLTHSRLRRLVDTSRLWLTVIPFVRRLGYRDLRFFAHSRNCLGLCDVVAMLRLVLAVRLLVRCLSFIAGMKKPPLEAEAEI